MQKSTETKFYFFLVIVVTLNLSVSIASLDFVSKTVVSKWMENLSILSGITFVFNLVVLILLFWMRQNPYTSSNEVTNDENRTKYNFLFFVVALNLISYLAIFIVSVLNINSNTFSDTNKDIILGFASIPIIFNIFMAYVLFSSVKETYETEFGLS